MDPDMIRDILINYNTFHKPKGNFLLKLLVDGLAFEEGERWAKLRQILNPAFNLHKLKVRNNEILIQGKRISDWTL